MDCKAFYYVFCDLEEKSHFPWDNPQKQEDYYNDYLSGNRPYLEPALITNGVFAAELALKYLTAIETGKFDCIHKIDSLFYSLLDIHKNTLVDIIKRQAQQDDSTLRQNLELMSNHFENWRYFFQNDVIAYNGFVIDFIHIVCDYAISCNNSEE